MGIFTQNHKGIYFKTSSSSIQYTNGGSEVMTFLSSGNVGIGTTSPSYKLQVGNAGALADSIRIGSYDAVKNTRQYIGYARQDTGLFETSTSGNTPSSVLPGVSGIRIVNTEGSVLSTKADQSIQLLTHIYNGYSRVALHANYDGNVGIGTTSPSQKLNVSGNILATGTILGSNLSGTNTGDQVLPTDFVSAANGGTFSGNLSIDIADGGSAPAMTALFKMNGYEGRGVGIKIKDSVNSATSPNSREWFVGSGYNNTGFNIGYSATGSQSSYSAQRKLNITTEGVVTIPGNVGIGTTSPSTKLHIVQPGGSSQLTLERTGAAAGKAVLAGAAEGLIVYDDAYGAKMYVGTSGTYNGKVGIGTTSPGAKLELAGFSGEMLKLNDSSATGNPYISFFQANTRRSYIQHVDSGDNLALVSEYGGIRFMTGTSGTETDKMRITSSGNVGIGTTSPSTPLDVNGEINASGDGYYINGTAWAVQYSNVLTLGDWDGNDFPTRIMDNNSNEILRVAGGGVGVGTTSPGSKLDIVGATNTGSSSLLRLRSTTALNSPEKVVGFYSGSNPTNERGYISLNQYAVTYSTSSDYRLKENIIPISNGIERLKELKPCRFNFIQGDPNYVVDGFIAHEAAEVIPEAVTGEKDAVDEDNNPSYQGIDQSKIVPLLTAALKEAISKIEQLETRIQTLENK